jgi:hypothetical protein
VGISPTALSQAVVDTILALAHAYRAQDQTALQRLLGTPIFTVPPSEVAARLDSVPLVPVVDGATTRADASAFCFSHPMN